MTLSQLKTFLWISRLGGIRCASEHLHISQPAISARLNTLEESLGIDLFERHQQGMTLTKKGTMLIPYVEQIMFLLERIQAEIIPPEALQGFLRIGVTEAIVQSWLPDFVLKLRSIYPQIKLEVSVDLSHNLREQLINRTIDLAILMGPITEHTINNINLPSFELGWFHAPALIRPNLTTTPIITYHQDSNLYQHIKLELIKRYGTSGDLFPSGSLSASFKMVEVGLGIGILPKMLAQPMLEAGTIVEFNPGWEPKGMYFTASYIAEIDDTVAKTAAQIALDSACLYKQ